MASQQRYRLTYFSTPSSVTHEAHAFWNGTLFNKGKSTARQKEIDVSYPRLAGGVLCEDKQFRQIVTVEDAVRGGCKLLNLDDLLAENSDEDFANLFLCHFIDNATATLSLAEMERCMVDSSGYAGRM